MFLHCTCSLELLPKPHIGVERTLHIFCGTSTKTYTSAHLRKSDKVVMNLYVGFFLKYGSPQQRALTLS